MTYSPTRPRDSMSTWMSCLDTNWDLTPWVVHKATKIGKEVSSLPELELTAKSILVDYFWIGIAISSSLLTFCACIFQRHRGKSGSFIPCFFFWSSWAVHWISSRGCCWPCSKYATPSHFLDVNSNIIERSSLSFFLLPVLILYGNERD